MWLRQMLGNFPKDFSQVETSQGYFPKWQLPKCAISQAATSKVFLAAALGPKPVQDAELGPLANPSRSARPPCSLRCLRGPNLWEVSAWEIAHLGCCHLGNCLLGSRPWENAFGKIANTCSVYLYIKTIIELITDQFTVYRLQCTVYSLQSTMYIHSIKQIDSSTIDGNLYNVQLYSDVTSVFTLFYLILENMSTNVRKYRFPCYIWHLWRCV